ncbi:hypothetical protein [Sphingomonas phage Kimi]|nr:hypothetical protein [Sphingomonas phage Kimi]
MKCQYEKQGSRCYSPGACKDWGYCRQRNIDAGGMRNVTPEDQARWRQEDNPA